ncbi:MAG: COR domain-containing protein [Planctomycetota bacterium]
MKTFGQLIRVTPQELDDILSRLKSQRATSLAVIGSKVGLPFYPDHWPVALPRQFVYQLSEPWPLVGKVLELRYLDQLVLMHLNIGDAGAHAIAERLPRLTSLEVSGNNIGEAGARAIAERLPQLTSLDVSGNNIGEAGARAIAERLPQLTSLDISHNKIGDVGVRAIAVHLPQLTSLFVNGNNIGEAGARAIAAHLLQLTSLNIRLNNIGDVGAFAIAERLARLTSLHVSDNKISDAGALAIGEDLPQLTSLHVRGNKISDAGAFAIAEHLPQLTSLNVSSNSISEAGARAIAEHLPRLLSLDMSGNNIGEVGAREIAERLPQLLSLDVSGNNIGEAGARAIAERLPRLTSLDVSRNSIGEAGARAIAEHLPRLTSLFISGNKIGDAGAIAIVEHLQSLRRLIIAENQAGQPTIDAIGRSGRALTELSLARNKQIRDVTPLVHLPSLRKLVVSGTSVSDLAPFADRIAAGWPVKWHGLATAGLLVQDCPLVRPTVEIARQGPEAVRNYFRELEAQGDDYLYEAKVLILGEGGAGKTSLLRRLYQPDLALPREDETTRGIDIHCHEFVGNHGQPFRLNVWDFGGQQIYHATHQFFLTKNSLYILVDDTRKDHKSIHDEGFKFWLEVVETLTEGSPLLIFQNEKGDRSKDIDKLGIQGRFANFKDLLRGNLESPGSAKSLQQAIEYYVQQLPHIGEAVPKKWVVIRKELEELAGDKPYVSQDEYFDVYRRHLPFDRTKALHLSRYLHDLGAFLHFQNDPLLSKSVILQNRWATEAVFRILDDESIKSNRGRFTADDCQRLWSTSDYADMHFELRGLMEKFELCYRLDAPHVGQWLAPQLLSPSKPAALANWARSDDLVVRFHYPFLPRGLVSRLIVRQHRFVQQLESCWARGSLFEHQGTEVLVEETTKGNEIELRARGPEQKALLSVLSSDLDAVNDSFKGLQGRVEKLVPCLCSMCQQTTDPEMFKQSLLVDRKRAGKKLTIECHKSSDDVNVLELLDGLKLDQLPQWASTPIKPECDADVESFTAGATELKTIKIFLASSAELREDRDAFDLHFRQQNDHFKDQGVYLQIVRWEHFLDAMSKTRLQDEYNKALRDCDIVVSLYRTKVGKFTEEEFDVAWTTFSATDKPKIYTYFRSFQLTGDEIESKSADLKSLERFKKRLTKLGHFPTSYTDAEHLKRQFRDQLTQLKIVN